MAFWRRLYRRQAKKSIGASGESFFSRLAQSDSPRRGSKELLEAYRESPWLHSVTKKIAEHIAAVPWTLSVIKRGGVVQRASQVAFASKKYREKMLRRYKQAGELQELTEHPFLDMMAKANPKMTGLQGRMTTQLLLDLKGECPWLLVVNKLNQPIEFWPIPPHWIREFPTERKPWYDIELNGARQRVPIENMLFQKYIDPADPYGRGTGSGDAMADEIDTDIQLAQTIKAGFYNRALPELIIGIQNAEVSEEELERLASKFKDRHRGALKRSGVHFHTGELTVEQLTQSFAEMQALEMRSWEREAFHSMFGVPPEIMGLMGSSNRATSHEAQRIFAREVLIPRLEHQRSEYQEFLIPLYGKGSEKLIVGYESPEPDDAEFSLEVAQANPGALTRGEWRQLSGHEHRGDVDDVHMMSFGDVLVPAGEAVPEAPQVAVEEDVDGYISKTVVKTESQIVSNTLEALDADLLINEVQPEWAAQIESWGQGTLEGLGVTGQGFNMLNPFVVGHLETFAGDRIKGLVNGTTREMLRQELVDGIRHGEGYEDLSKRVAHVFEQSKDYRSDRIARTEVTRSANFATHEAQKQSGIVEKRQWISTPDEKTRDEHAYLGGSEDGIVGVDEPFKVNGHEAMYPGDFADPALSVNCRCTVIAVVNPPPDWGDIDPDFGIEEGKSLTAEQSAEIWHKSFEDPADRWEAVAAKAFRRGFEKQEAKVRDALKRILG